ncbi:Homeobox-like domain superfamily [Arabidopsis suecica]|uniref:ELM2 domain-containing protein n=2 Tax=Arabidopsis TaxID=3701 RepID=A0A5S9WPS2_ARATH|nr:Homeobox-like domain superfamily [Arabidopsis suecica]CAA0295904.1 unnamed protein product [Arabidopsis thaliana]
MMEEENSSMEESCDEEFVCGDPKVDIRVGDEYQVEIPPMMSESQRAELLLNPLEFDSSCSFAVGLPVEVMWIETKCRDGDGLGSDNIDMNESLKSLKRKRSRRGGSDGNSGSKRRMNLEAVPEKSSSSWEDLEVDGFVLGLYTFGKNFAQVQKLLESKATGEILLFYYGKFYGSAKYKTWSNYLKKRSTRCIQGKKLYSDWRLQLLLSRLIRSITDESKEQKLVDVSKSFAEGKKSLEEYINAVKKLVGLRCLVEAVAIGKDKEDLTVLTTKPVDVEQWFRVSSAVPAGLGEYNSLTVEGIIEKLSGGSRVSKARCNDIFWDAVWPRLLHRGWRSELPKDRGYIKSKEHIVFLVPGVKKFSRKKLVKRDHYFDSISDILKKVVSEPELLEETAEEEREENTYNQSKQEKHCYLRSPSSSSTHMKFTVVDTSRFASRGKLYEFRELRIPSLASQSKACRGDNNSSVERFKFADERKCKRKQKMEVVDEPMTFLILDTSVDKGGHTSGIRRRRHLPKEAFGESSQNQSGTSKDVNCEYLKGTDPGVEEETLENVQQGRSKKIKQKFALLSESNKRHLVGSLPLRKRRRLSTCVRKDRKRSGESSVLKPPPLDQITNSHPKLHVDSMNLNTNQSEENENIEIQERPETEPNGFCSISETVHEPSSSAQQQEPNGLRSSKEQGALHDEPISLAQQQEPNGLYSSKEQGAFHEHSSTEQQQDESNRLCLDKICSSKDLGTAQKEEQPIQLPPKSASDKNSPSRDHGTTEERASLEQQEEEHKQQANTDIPRRQSTRKRPLTTRALEALESDFFTPKSKKTTTSKPRNRERSARIKHSANANNKTPGESDNSFHVKEAITSKPSDQIKDSEPSFLVDKVTVTSSKHVEQIKDSEKVTTEFPKLPPIVLKLPFRRGSRSNED